MTSGLAPWNGGNQPVGDTVDVQVQLRMGAISRVTPARYWRWSREQGKDCAGDIIAWRRA